MNYSNESIDQIRFITKRSVNKALVKALDSSEAKKIRRMIARGMVKQINTFIKDADFINITGLDKALDPNVKEKVDTYWVTLAAYMSVEAFNEYLVFAGNIGGQSFFTKVGIDAVFDLRNPAVIKQLTDPTNLLIKSVDNTTKNTISRIITNGMDEGLSSKEISKRLSDGVMDFSLNRAELIVHAETANAISVTELRTAKENGYTQKGWNNAGDNRVTPECRHNTGQGWIGINESFASGHQAPPRFPRCRCAQDFNTATKLPYNTIWNG